MTTDAASAPQRTAWQRIRVALGATSLFNGPTAPATVSGLSLRVNSVSGGYSVLQATAGTRSQAVTKQSNPSSEAAAASSIDASDGRDEGKTGDAAALNPAGKLVPGLARAAVRAKSKSAAAARAANAEKANAEKANAEKKTTPADEKNVGQGVQTAAASTGKTTKNDDDEKIVGQGVQTAAASPAQSAAAPADDEVTVQEGAFTVNGTSVTVTADDTLDSVLSKITASGAGVIATYVEETQQVTLTSTQLTTEPITVGNDTSGFLTAVGLDATAKSLTATQSSPFDVALADMTEYSAVKPGAVTANGHDIAVDPATTTVRGLVSTLNSLPDVSASLNDASGAVTISSLPGGTIALSDTSGTLASLGIAPGTYTGSGTTMVAVQTRAAAAPVPDPAPGKSASLPSDGVRPSVAVDRAAAHAAKVEVRAPRAVREGRRVERERLSARTAPSGSERQAWVRHASPQHVASRASRAARTAQTNVSSAVTQTAVAGNAGAFAGIFDGVLNVR